MEVLFESAKVALIAIFAALAVGLTTTMVYIGRDRWREAGSLSGSLRKVLRGEVKTDRNGLRDPRVTKGKVWDETTQCWRSQGKLADEYIKNMVS